MEMRIIYIRRLAAPDMSRVALLLVLLVCAVRARGDAGSQHTDPRGASNATRGLPRFNAARCRTAVEHDTALSGNTTLEPAFAKWSVSLSTRSVLRGGVAALACRTAPASGTLAPFTWFRGDERIHVPEPTPESRYLVAGDTLLVRDIAPADAGAYSCIACGQHSRPALLRLTEAGPLRAPRLRPAQTRVQAAVGELVCLPCLAEGWPTPRLAWRREGFPPAGEVDAWLWRRGAALCLRAHAALAGAWRCEAHNALGRASRRVLLSVEASSRRSRRSPPGTELHLGDSVPELQYTFIEQALRAGGGVSLRCAASGEPAPRLAWLLDGAPLDHFRAHHRYLISSEVSTHGAVVSTLNISAATPADGGRYSCRASNRLGDAEHSARLNIYGPPSIRATGPVRVVAGANATIYCPYAGYPISSIAWWRRGGGAALGAGGRVSARGAALRLTPALAADAGHYACAVTAPDGAQARRDIELQVRNPPKISPFMFSSELTEGSSAQVLCGVSSGDKPMYFSWTKDGAPLPSSLQIEEKSLNEFSLLMFSDLTARHSGDYTCRVSNHAATANFTATLSVKVAPAWVSEPADAAVLLGAPLALECAAKGYPVPAVTWYKKLGEGLGPDNEHWEQVTGAWQGGPALAGAGEPAGPAGRGALSASATERRHQGVYRCTVDNGVGPPLVKSVNLTVHEPAGFESSVGNVSSVRGRGAALACLARGDPPLAVSWSHRGARLDLHSYRWTVSEARTATGLRSTLQLRAAERSDAGEYRCHATNQYGRSEMLMYLHVEEPPAAPAGVRLGGVGARWVRVAWRAARGGAGEGAGAGEHYAALCTALHALPDAEPRAAANLTLEPEDDGPDADGMRSLAARLEGLRPAAAYSLRIVAGNHVGRSPHSEPLMFTTLEEAPSAPPQNVRARAAGPGELRVSWSAPAQRSWNGELLGYAVSWRGAEDAGRAAAAGWSGEELTLGGLRGAARYAVRVRAYNRAGAGPGAAAVYAAAGGEGGAPHAPRCEPEGSRALRVRWPPPEDASPQGYDVFYAPLQLTEPWIGSAEPVSVRAGAAGEATLQGLAPNANYSVWLRARGPQPAPPSAPAHCVTAPEAPGAVTSLRVLSSGEDSLLVTWLPPAHAPPDTHYTLHVRAAGGAAGGAGGGAERALRVEGAEGEVRREVRGLRGVPHDVWVEATARAGRGPPSRVLSGTPGAPGAPRLASFPRSLAAGRGARVRLQCAAVGAEPLRRRWSGSAAPGAEDGSLALTARSAAAGNYTCAVRNALGADAVTHRLRVLAPPAAPAPRLARAAPHSLHLVWDPPDDGDAPVLGYTVRWSRAEAGEGQAEAVRAGGEGAVLRRLACGALYRVTLHAHNALGDSPPSRPLLARTEGEKPRAPPGEEFVWANSTALRLNLLAWRARCSVPAFRLALRPALAPPRPWTPLPAGDDSAEAGDLQPGAWYEIRAVAASPAGETIALYRAPTRTLAGERIGEAAEIPATSRPGRADAAGPAGAAAWRAGAAPALLAAGLAALLAALVGAVVARRRRSTAGMRREVAAAPQLYAAEPGAPERNGKALAPPEGDPEEISPYATFSMSGGGEGAGACAGAGCPQAPGRRGGGCALHLRTFGRGEALDLAAPPPRPNLLSHPEYGRGRDSDSESSGSPCAACAHELYRLPAHRPHAETLPCPESSAEETSGGRSTRTPRHAARARRRRDPPPAPSLRYEARGRRAEHHEPL